MDQLPQQGAPNPEQMQLQNILGSIGACDYGIAELRKVPLTIENLGKLQQTIQWMEEICNSLRREYQDLSSRMPAKPSEPTPRAAPVPVTPIGKKKK